VGTAREVSTGKEHAANFERLLGADHVSEVERVFGLQQP
jgi:hypothetical protein